MSTAWKPHAVSFSSGGVRLVGHLGCLAALLDTDVLSDVRDWYGCSAGAVCAFLAALGVSARWIRDAKAMFDARILTDIRGEYIMDFLTTWAVSSTDSFIAYLSRLADTWEPGSSKWTFAEFARERQGYGLYITASNVSKHRLDVFSADTTPSICIMDAIRASCAIPMMFMPITLNGDVYCDGGVIELYPWMHVKEKEKTLVILTEDTCVSTNQVQRPITSLVAYATSIFWMMSVRAHRMKPMPRFWIAVNNKEVHFADFHMTVDARDRFFAEGEQAARSWLSFRQKAVMSGTARTLPSCEGLGTDASGPDAPDRMSDIPKVQTPLQPLSPSLGLHTASSRIARRWSL
jgi:predicted acylesterase/phospholipase RssA